MISFAKIKKLVFVMWHWHCIFESNIPYSIITFVLLIFWIFRHPLYYGLCDGRTREVRPKISCSSKVDVMSSWLLVYIFKHLRFTYKKGEPMHEGVPLEWGMGRVDVRTHIKPKNSWTLFSFEISRFFCCHIIVHIISSIITFC